MGLFSKVLLTVDFDRTITAPDSSIPEANLAAIRYFMAEDGAFTVNTGRSVPMFAPYLNAIPHNAPWLLYNGSAAYDGEELSQLREIPLDRGAFFRALRRKFPELNIEEQGIGGHYTYWDNPVFQEFYRQVGAAHRQMVLEENHEPFLKVSLFGSPRAYCVADLFDATAEEEAYFSQAVEWLKEAYGDKIEVFRAASRIIDIHAKGVSKIASARQLQKNLGREILVCVGDAENDLPMLQGADYAFCPADGVVADRFPNVCPCGEGAVAQVIYEKIPEILGINP